jgi:hypothetical protein
MTRDEAIAECRRYLAYNERQRERSVELGRIAAKRRAGEMDLATAQRQMRALEQGVGVYDGGNLELAVKQLLKEIGHDKG